MEKINEEEVVGTEEETSDEPQKDWKAEAEKLAGINKRLKSKLDKYKETPSEPNKPSETKSDGLDYGQKAFLISNGIKKEEFEFVQSELQNSGKTLEELLDNNYFKQQLEDNREFAKTKEATPDNTNRTGESPKTAVDYWVNKGELPPNTPENQQLRREVVNKRIDLETNGSKFASNSTGTVDLQSNI